MSRRQFQRLDIRGVNSDLLPDLVDDSEYNDVRNMEPSDNGMRTTRGLLQAFGTPVVAPEFLMYNTRPNLFYWLYAGSDGAGVYDGAAHFDISPTPNFTSLWPATWVGANLNSLMALTNGVDTPKYWDNNTSNPMVDLPGWPAGLICKSLRAFNYNLIAMNITGGAGDYDNQILWSNSVDPGAIPDEWTAAPSNDAGDNLLADTPGSVLDGLQYRDQFMLFKQFSTYVMTPIGGNLVFGFRKFLAYSGILAPNCAAEYMGNMYVLTDGDFIVTDGQDTQSLIDKRMRTWLFNQIDPDNYDMAHVIPYHARNQIIVAFPENGNDECTLALVLDARDGKIGVRELKPTPHIARGQVGDVTGVVDWNSDSESWQSDVSRWGTGLFNPTLDALLQAGRVEVELYAWDQGTLRDGAIQTHSVERRELDFGIPDKKKLIKRMRPRIVGQAGTVLNVRVGSSDTTGDPVSWSAAQQFVIGQANEWLSFFAKGKLLSFSIEAALNQESWEVVGVEFEYSQQGRY